MNIRMKSIATLSVIILCSAFFMAGTAPLSIAQEAKTNGAGPTVTINVDAVDIVQVLNAFSQQTGQSIVVAPEVKGTVTARLKGIPWQEAMQVILEPHGLTYQQTGSTVLIMAKKDGLSLEGLKTEVFKMSFLDVSDVKPILETCLSPIGKLTILGTQAEKGWDFASGSSGGGGGRSGGSSAASVDKRKRGGSPEDRLDFSKTLIITDVEKSLDKIRNLIGQLDVVPSQILIEARFVEVSAGALVDLGIEFGTGKDGASGSLKTDLRAKGDEVYGLGAQSTSGGATPVAFKPKGANVNGTTPFNTGMSMAFQKLTGTEFEILLHALEEDAKAKTLSVPSILTVNNQEAAIIVGTKFPIIQSQTTGDSSTTSTSLEYYENIGIQLNVVPQVCGDGHIRMMVHPAVTDQIGTASAKTSTGLRDEIPLTEYPILSTREADTQVIIKSGETIVIGGLLAERDVKSEFKVPLLGDIPYLGWLFRRETTNKEKAELVIFITATLRTSAEAAKHATDIEKRLPEAVPQVRKDMAKAEAAEAAKAAGSVTPVETKTP